MGFGGRSRVGRDSAWITVLAFPVWLALTGAPAFAHGPTHDEIEALSSRIGAGGAAAADYLRRGELRRISGAWDAALEDYGRAARLDPSLIDVDVCRGALFLDIGQPARALAALDPVLRKAPDHAPALLVRARALAALGRPLEAVQDLDRMMASGSPVAPDHYLERARTLASCGDGFLVRALRGLDEGIERLGPIASLESYAIDLELRRRNFSAALARLDRLAPQFGNREALLERRGRILAAAGRADEARAAYAAALAEIESLPPPRRGSRVVFAREARLRALLEGGPEPAPLPAATSAGGPSGGRP